TIELLTAFTNFAPLRMIPLCSAAFPTMNPVILEKKNRKPDLITIHDKACGFVGAVRINDATHLDPFRLGAHLQTLAGDDADRTTPDPRISCYQSLAVISFVFIERIGVDDSGK